MLSLLKKSSKSYKQSPELVAEFHAKARRTLKVITNNMVNADMPVQKILDMYERVERQNVIVLILRCKKLYEARFDVRRLLVFLLQKEVQIQT